MGVLEGLDDVRIFKPHLIDVLVFLLDDLVEIIIAKKAQQAVRGYVPGLRNLDVSQVI